MRKIFPILCAILMFLMGCGTSTPHKPDSSKPAKISAIFIYPTDARYPSALWNAGVQGDVELRVELEAEGIPPKVMLMSSSRSPELDQIAVGIGRELKYKVNSPTFPVSVIVPVKFVRDSLETLLHQKTCFEFNVDLAYFRLNFPEAKTREMNAINLMVGLFFANGLHNVPKEERPAYDARLTAAPVKIIEACAMAPQARYAKTFADLVMGKK